jgi:hypothetical protein
VPDPTTVVPAPDPLPIDDVVELPVGRLSHLKQQVSSLFHRASTSDLATGMQIAATSGGGRVATVAAVLGMCLSGAGVATVCVVTGVVSDPLGLLREAHPRVVATPDVTHRAPSHTPARAVATPAPTPAVTPAPRRTTPRRRQVTAAKPAAAAAHPSQGTTPTSHESAPISPAPASTTGHESFGPETPQTPASPAPAPATGGAEFGP